MNLNELVMSADEENDIDQNNIRFAVDVINYGLKNKDLTFLKMYYEHVCKAIQKKNLSIKNGKNYGWDPTKTIWYSMSYDLAFNVVFELVCGKVTFGYNNFMDFGSFYELVELEQKKPGRAKRKIIGATLYSKEIQKDLPPEIHLG